VLVEAEVNRVSLGVQSFHVRELALLGRRHSPEQARQAAAALRSAGIGNLSVDLIYGIPGQTLASWRDSLRQAVDLGAEHLSSYALNLEPGTPLGRAAEAGRVRPADEQLQKDCYEAAIDLARAAGLEHYEISNFARPGRRCRHNLTYWRNEPYLGLGPAAASYVAGVRRTNRPDLAAYLQAIEAGLPPPADSEKLVGRAAMAETVMLGLRLIEGLDRAAFAQRFGQDMASVFPRTVARYAEQGALIVTERHVRLEAGVLFVSDTILADFLAEAETGAL
jgi:oxygen-independent coproporphyrinogen-3 oxidase